MHSPQIPALGFGGCLFSSPSISILGSRAFLQTSRHGALLMMTLPKVLVASRPADKEAFGPWDLKILTDTALAKWCAGLRGYSDINSISQGETSDHKNIAGHCRGCSSNPGKVCLEQGIGLAGQKGRYQAFQCVHKNSTRAVLSLCPLFLIYVTRLACPLSAALQIPPRRHVLKE